MEVQTLDSLRKLVRELQDENKKLKEQLKKANIAFPEQSVFEEKIEDSEEYDPDQGGRIMNRYITEAVSYTHLFPQMTSRMHQAGDAHIARPD